MNRVNYLLLGAGGQLGTAFRSLLRERGQEYLAFDQELDITDQVSSPTYTRDLARATLKLLETGLYGRYHLCNSGSCSRYGWAEFILKQINWSGKLLPAKSADFDTLAARPQYSMLDSLPYTQLVGEELPGWQEATADFLARIRGA
jgi:dTDP-4-dehydrorhamnose reductase